jgi:hypothetical protein
MSVFTFILFSFFLWLVGVYVSFQGDIMGPIICSVSMIMISAGCIMDYVNKEDGD